MLLNDLSCAVDSCSVPVTVTRYLPVEIVNGAPASKNSQETFDILMSVQPISARELQRMPEGMRNEGAVQGFTTTELLTVQTSTVRIPDEFVYRCIKYQVQQVEDWFELGGYYKILAVRMNT